jgi:hypothetical protein
MRIDANIWFYSPDHCQLCQVIEAQTLWGETTCRVWLPACDSVVRIPAPTVESLESAGTGSPDDIAYIAAAARVADALTQYVLLAQDQKAFQEELDQKAQAFLEMAPLLIVRVEDGV